MKNIIPLLSFLTLLFAQNEIEGRWHLVGYEDAVMYEFVDTEPFADAGLRYSIYADENGEFDDLDGDNIGGTPHPYSVAEDIITIDTHFGNILSYQMNFRCDGQVVEFIDIDYNAIHSTLFKEGFDYFNSDCEQVLEECFDFTNNDFGACTMVLGVGLLNDECSYISGCDWTIDGIDYTFESILPGYYGSRPRHIHIKITIPNGTELVSQLYFENDPYCENDQWCQDADDRIIPLIEDEYGLNGEIDLIMSSSENGILLGDINFDNLLNVQDVILLVGIILNNTTPNDFQIYSSDVNNDNNIDILDIVQLVAIIIN